MNEIVRQITNFPLKAAAGPGDALLLQVGGLGGPYVYTTSAGLLQALGIPGGQLGVGMPLPGDAVGTGLIANQLATQLGGTLSWNAYVNDLGVDAFIAAGRAAQLGFDGTTFGFHVSPPGFAGQAVPQPWQPLLTMDMSGNMQLAGQLQVASDPVLPREVATMNFVMTMRGQSVTSFNGQVGDVVLSLQDLLVAGAAPLLSPQFAGYPTAPSPSPLDNSTALATTEWVNFAVCSKTVHSFMDRSGPVRLELQDILEAGGAPICSPTFQGEPTAPTPNWFDRSDRIATTDFVAQATFQNVSRRISAGPYPPLHPQNGDLWWDASLRPSAGNLYVWYVDGGIGSWVIANSQQGAEGPQGPPGTLILGSYPDLPSLLAAHPVGNPGDAYLVAGVMYVWSVGPPAQWLDVGSLVGPTGPMGPAGPPSYLLGSTPPTATFGELWFNTTDNSIQLYDGTTWLPAGYLKLGGGTLTGALTLAGDATANLQPVTLQQATALISTSAGNYLPLAGGTLTGALVLSGDATANLNPVTLQQLNASAALYLPLAGGTITGNLTVNGTTTFVGVPSGPTAALGTNTTQLASTAFVQTTRNNMLPLTGTAPRYLLSQIASQAAGTTPVWQDSRNYVASLGDFAVGTTPDLSVNKVFRNIYGDPRFPFNYGSGLQLGSNPTGGRYNWYFYGDGGRLFNQMTADGADITAANWIEVLTKPRADTLYLPPIGVYGSDSTLRGWMIQTAIPPALPIIGSGPMTNFRITIHSYNAGWPTEITGQFYIWQGAYTVAYAVGLGAPRTITIGTYNGQTAIYLTAAGGFESCTVQVWTPQAAHGVPGRNLATSVTYMDIPSAALFTNRTQMVFANSTYINNPSFWPSAGQEQDLGDGTFGRRFTGSFTQAADVLLQSVLTTAVTNANARIIKSGGWFDVGPNHAQVGQYLTLGATTWWSALYTQPTGVVLNTFVSSARSAAAYDVWIRYWKVPPP